MYHGKKEEEEREREIKREGKLKLFPERKHSRKQTQRIGRERVGEGEKLEIIFTNREKKVVEREIMRKREKGEGGGVRLAKEKSFRMRRVFFSIGVP